MCACPLGLVGWGERPEDRALGQIRIGIVTTLPFLGRPPARCPLCQSPGQAGASWHHGTLHREGRLPGHLEAPVS